MAAAAFVTSWSKTIAKLKLWKRYSFLGNEAGICSHVSREVGITDCNGHLPFKGV